MESIKSVRKQLGFAGVGWSKWPKDALDWQADVNPVIKDRSFLKGVKSRDSRVLKRTIYSLRCLFTLNLTAVGLSVTVSSGMVGPLFSCTLILVRGDGVDVTRQGIAPLYDSFFNQTLPLFNYF